MTPTAEPSKEVLEIRKYSNRRYYDATHSRHLTLEEIREFVREGHDIRVTDNQTSADITAKILTQIILDFDTPKLDLFPTALLAQLIRTNDQLVKGFYESFFGQALTAFLNYQRLVETQLKRGSILPAMFPPMATWTQAMMNPFLPEAQADKGSSAVVPPSAEPDLDAKLHQLQRQVDEIRGQVGKSSKRERGRVGKKRGR